MNREAFDIFVRYVERRFARRPLALRAQILLLALSSYGWICALPLALGSLALAAFFAASTTQDDAGWIFTIFGVVLLGLAVWSLVARVWVRIDPPEGRRIERKEAPALFAMLDELRHTLKAAKIHGVVLNGQLNAGVQQAPRLGMLGWSRNFLTLGLPLLDALSPGELRAVLAHEYAHISAAHGRFSAWVYRLRCTWERLFEQYRKEEAAGQVVKRPFSKRFVEWFWPRFHAHAFVLSRANEYEADAVAARIASAERCASSLLRVQYYDRLLGEKVWRDIWLDANTQAEMPSDVYIRVRDEMHAGATGDESSLWIEQSFRTTTSNADTHPSMSDRLRALNFLPADLERGHFPPAPKPPVPSASAALLGSAEPVVRRDISEQWKKDAADFWKQTHKRANALQHRLDSIHQSTAHYGDEDADSLWEKACVTMNLESLAAAVPLLQRLVEVRPDHAGAQFNLGRHLLDSGDPAGEVAMERAMELDEEAIPDCCENLILFHRRLGRDAKVRELEQRLDRHEAALKASHAERNMVAAADELIAHGLPGEETCRIEGILRGEREITGAFLARKKLVHFPKQRVFVLVIHIASKWFGGREREEQIVQRVFDAAMLPGRFIVITPSGFWTSLARKVCAVAGAKLFAAR